MANQLVGEPAVAAFLQSVLQNLDAILARGCPTPFVSNDPIPELEKLKEKLFWFQDLLFDGETRRLSEKSVDKWMDDLKDLVYDVDDILDDIPVQVSDHLSHDDFSSSSAIKDSLCKVLVRADPLLEKAKPEHLNLKRSNRTVLPWGQSQPIRHRPETSPSIDKSEIHGREEDIKRIVDMLLEANGSTKKKYDVICIVGMGGLGKTTLAQLVFDDQEVARHFDVKRWACISDVFDVARATKDLIENSRQSGGAHSLQSLPALHDELKRIVENKRILFVLDDVWTAEEWDEMKAPLSSCGNGSKILVTTRIDQVARAMSNNRSPYRLGKLGHEQCRAIFKDKAFGEIDVDDVDPELKKLGEEIVNNCEGVPLAVKVIGSMLQGAKEEKWKAVLENSLWNAAYDKIHPAMRLSYHYLPACLKRCFEYFAVFPSDYQFDQVQLVRMWIAEGLVEEVQGRMAEDIGNEYYNDLKGRSLIQENDMIHDIIHHLSCMVSKKFCYRANSCKPHASMRHASFVYCSDDAINYGLFDEAHSLRTLILDEDIACKLEDKIWSCKMLRVLNLSGGGYSNDLSEVPSSISDMKHLRYLRLPESKILINLPESICMLSNLQVLDLGECPLKNFPNNLNYLSNLRCLILHSSELSSLPDSICMLSNLQVLDLAKCSLENLPNNLNYLSNLQCLILRSSKLSSLPESVCSLCKLQVLDLQYCHNLGQLPKDIGNLRSLWILKLRFTPTMLPESIVNVTGLQKLKVDPDKLPPYIGRLSRLQGLPNYQVGKKKGRGIDQLRDMNRLKGKLTIDNMENIEGEKEASMADLKSKKHIRELAFLWCNTGNYDAEMELKIIEALQPHGALQSLTFSGYNGNRLPDWIMSSLGNLTHLVMEGLKMVNRMVEMEFASLVTLTIKDCPMLSEVVMATPKLRELEVSCCRELRAASFVLLPSLVSDSADLHLIIAQLEGLECPYHVFEHFIQQLEAANSCCTKLKKITVMAGGVEVASLPRGWPSIFKSVEILQIKDIDQADFQLLPNVDGSADFPPSLRELNLTNVKRMARLPSDLCNLTSLMSLHIYNFPCLISFEIQELPPDLQSFSISRCGNLANFTSLRNVSVGFCPNLSLIQELPRDLQSLSILNCENLTKLPDGFANFTSLRHVFVADCPNLSLIQELPRDLQSLSISNCENLTKLPDGFANFTSLNYVYLYSCPNLVIFQDEMIPPNATFRADDCPHVVSSRSSER